MRFRQTKPARKPRRQYPPLSATRDPQMRAAAKQLADLIPTGTQAPVSTELDQADQ